MSTLTDESVLRLAEPLPIWAVKQHPTKKNLSVIHPMAVVDRLNDVFGVGGWNYHVDYISCDKEIQQTKNGEREIYVSAVKGRMWIPEHEIALEQFGGSTNDDRGDALKGGATDALTKIASYLGVGASIYKGKGNGTVETGVPAFDDGDI